jgi:transcriptional regulator with XRE-family HTH domain
MPFDIAKRSPQQIRDTLSDNLALLTAGQPISKICREIPINRTQFNRYRSGESFPRADVLDRICRYFDVSAEIVRFPLDELPESEERRYLRTAIASGQLDVTYDFETAIGLVRLFAGDPLAAIVVQCCEFGFFSPQEMSQIVAAAELPENRGDAA